MKSLQSLTATTFHSNSHHTRQSSSDAIKKPLALPKHSLEILTGLTSQVSSSILVKPQTSHYQAAKLSISASRASRSRESFNTDLLLTKTQEKFAQDIRKISSGNFQIRARRHKLSTDINLTEPTKTFHLDSTERVSQFSKLDSMLGGKDSTKLGNQTFYKSTTEGNFSLINDDAAAGFKTVLEQLRDAFFSDFVGDVGMCLNHLKFNFERQYTKFVLFPDSERAMIEGILHGNFHVLKVVKKLVSKALFLQQENTKLQKENDRLAQELAVARQKKDDIDESEELKQTKALLKESEKKYDQALNSWSAERVFLSGRIDLLSNSLAELQDKEKIGTLTTKLKNTRLAVESMQKLLLTKTSEYETQIAKFHLQMGSFKNETERSRKELVFLTDEVARLKTQLKVSETTIQDQKEQINEYRERAWMQREEFSYVRVISRRLKEVNAHLRFRLGVLTSKLDKLSKGHETANKHLKQEEHAQDRAVLNVVSDDFKSSNFTRVIQASKGAVKAENLPTHESLDAKLEKLVLCRPNFIRLFDDLFDRFAKTDEFAKIKKKLDIEFFGQIRAILDAKFNEHMYLDEPKCYSRLPEFVFSWLSSFTLNPITKKTELMTLEQQFKNDARIIQFLSNLKNPLYSNSWDVSVFKDFLDEKASIEEIHFYLLCRNMLFNGPQMNHSIASFTIVHYVTLEYAVKFLEHVLKSFGSDQIASVTSKIKSRAKRKGRRELIDSAFVLRILLEFYKNERKVRFLKIKDIFETIQVKGIGIKSLSFESFKEFMDSNYERTTELEKVELYRDSWNYGSGNVTPESFFVAATESGFFIHYLKVRPFKTAIDTNYAWHCKQVAKFLQESQQQNAMYVDSLKQKLNSLGIEKPVKEIQSIEYGIFKGLNLHEINLHGKTVYSHYYKIISHFLQVRNTYCISKWFLLDPEQELKIANQDIGSFKSFFETLMYLDKLDIAESREKDVKIRRVQQQIKKKYSRWNIIFNQLVKKKSITSNEIGRSLSKSTIKK